MQVYLLGIVLVHLNSYNKNAVEFAVSKHRNLFSVLEAESQDQSTGRFNVC